MFSSIRLAILFMIRLFRKSYAPNYLFLFQIDMVEIKEQFQAKYKKQLPGYIKDDTSGDYRHLLMALVGH